MTTLDGGNGTGSFAALFHPRAPGPPLTTRACCAAAARTTNTDGEK
eukprot:CAMPEP_0196200924 /NCGR_PEP_ID=MMETSP0912-20130531/4124_1 /TAXON_ID=49265 /ORGANISM="Thalassiosira rotula, Strain GSO102" /LENGTH=45 /DNA_ID= /DNA_START= /DNA_END= /DNA_ORIENTATION=